MTRFNSATDITKTSASLFDAIRRERYGETQDDALARLARIEEQDSEAIKFEVNRMRRKDKIFCIVAAICWLVSIGVCLLAVKYK